MSEQPAPQGPVAPGPPQKYPPKPLALFVTIRSYDGSMVDLEVTVVRGGQLILTLPDGPEDTSKPFSLLVGGGPRDTKHWICGPGGIVPARPTFQRDSS